MEKLKIKTIWNELAQNKRIEPHDMAAYMIAKAMFSKSNEKLEVAKALLLRAFTPITNYNKLHNGCSPFDGLKKSLRLIKWSAIASVLEGDQKTTFLDMARELAKEDWRDNTYCYILTRTDIPPIHQLVQTAHATMVAGQRYPNFDAKRLHFCVLAGGNEEQLREIGKSLSLSKIDYATFWESDAKSLWGGLPRKEITALACVPMRKSVAVRKKLFDRLELLNI